MNKLPLPSADVAVIADQLNKHRAATGSQEARRLLEEPEMLPFRFRKVVPKPDEQVEREAREALERGS